MTWGEAVGDATPGVFPRPPGSYENSDLPPCLTEPEGTQPYEARAWQAKDEGFGTILYSGKIAVAIHELDNTTHDRVNEILADHTAVFGASHLFNFDPKFSDGTLTGTYVKYWFWQSGVASSPGDQLLMICSTETSPDKFSVTTAIGWTPLMEALGMAPDVAVNEQRTAEEEIAKQRASKGPNPANSSNRTGS